VSVFVAIETSTDAGSVAIGAGAALTGEVLIGTRTRHAESLLPALDFLLRTSRTPKSAIAGIIVGAGPGSFTGVRVAAATARGLAHALAVPLFAYSSLAALASESRETGAVCALFDARRGEVYAACYERNGDRLTTLMEPAVLGVSDLQQRVREFGPVFVGEGANRYAAELGITARAVVLPRAAALLRLHAAQPDEGLVHDSAGWEPSYLRASGAERGIPG
jgi:tRNA threonylcarbamoyladenosine biosynthesis protein TsaB